eukprot:7543933-Pyramimonas_sp.AAC.1
MPVSLAHAGVQSQVRLFAWGIKQGDGSGGQMIVAATLPPARPIAPLDAPKPLQTLVSNVYLYFCSSGNVYGGHEQAMLPTTRYQAAGSREMFLFRAEDARFSLVVGGQARAQVMRQVRCCIALVPCRRMHRRAARSSHIVKQC